MNEEGVRTLAPTSATRVDFRVLGPVEAWVDGRQLPLGGPRQRTLLALLLVRAGRIVPVDELVDAIWVGEPPEGANTTIRSYVSRLRSALGEAASVGANASGYSISVGGDSVDAGRFERLVRDADDDLARGQPRAAAERLAVAVSLWRGRAFGDLSDDGPLRIEAERLDELRLHAAEQRFEAEIAVGNAARITDELEAAVAQYPFRERLWRLLMLALYHSGRQADALAAYRRARTMLDEHLGIDPTPDLQALEGQILRQELPSPTSTVRRDNLPAPLTSFVGRRTEIETLGRTLGEHRLVTLTGVGGVGKTRLAVEVARQGGELAADGVVFVDLAPVPDDDAVARAAARTLDLREQSGATAVELVTNELRHAQAIVVLDNCEHVRAGAAELADALRARCPHVRVIATSRMPLGSPGEIEVPLAPLSLPAQAATMDELRDSDAVQLLVERAGSSRPRGAGSVDDAALLEAARICRDLDGLPLAIELAAARAKAMTLPEIAGRLDDRFRFLVSWRRVSPARHQTLKQAIDWSYDLLLPDDQHVFAALSVFVGGFDLDGLAAVAAAGDHSRAADAVTRLVDASLISPEPQPRRSRYRMLETVRQYAASRLAETGATRSAQAEHALYFRSLAERAEPELSGAEQTEWFTRLDSEHDNFIAALRYLAADGTDPEALLEFTVSLTRFWYVRGHLTDARAALEHALDVAGTAPTLLRRRGLTAAASIALLQGEYAEATRLAEASLEAARATGEDRLVANGLSNLGAIVLAAGDTERAGELLTDAVAAARTAADTRILALALNNLGDYALTVGTYDRAEPLFRESLALLEERGDTANIARSLFNLSAVALKTGRISEADERLRQSLSVSDAAGDKEDICWGLLGLAGVAAASGSGERAALLLGAATNLLQRMGADFKPFERQLHDETRQRAIALLGTADFQAAHERGTQLTMERAVKVASEA